MNAIQRAPRKKTDKSRPPICAMMLTDSRGKTSSYVLTRLDSQTAVWQMEKVIRVEGEEPASYHLTQHLPAYVGDRRIVCDCWGHVAHGHCKHASALEDLGVMMS